MRLHSKNKPAFDRNHFTQTILICDWNDCILPKEYHFQKKAYPFTDLRRGWFFDNSYFYVLTPLMKKKHLWLLTLLVFIGYIVFWNFCINPLLFGDVWQVLQTLSTLVATLLTGVFIGLLLALIPHREKRYGPRLGARLPGSIILSCLFFAVFFWMNTIHYDEVSAASNADCKNLREGYFYYANVDIQRIGDTQVEWDNTWKRRKVYRLIWLNNCEYILYSGNDSSRVKIVNVFPNSYDCYVKNNGWTSPLIKIKRGKRPTAYTMRRTL